MSTKHPGPAQHDPHEQTERAIRQLTGHTIQTTAAIEHLEHTIQDELRRTRNAIGWQTFLAMIVFALVFGAVLFVFAQIR